MVYIPPAFEESERASLFEFISQNPLGQFVTLGSDGLVANHIPLIHRPAGDGVGYGVLFGHVARNNALWHDHDADVGALVIFQSANAYISPNWYPTKAETHQVVPTWNYAVVHVAGPLVIHDDERWVRAAVGRLTQKMEAMEPDPWKMADAPRDYTADQITRIVGIEIPITHIVGKFKAGQNRPVADIEGAIAGLRARSRELDAPMADIMADRIPEPGE